MWRPQSLGDWRRNGDEGEATDEVLKFTKGVRSSLNGWTFCYCLGRFYWCLARRQGKEEFGDTADSAADYNGYRLVNGDPSRRSPRALQRESARAPSRMNGATVAAVD